MNTDQLLHSALTDMAAATDELPGGGDHIRKLAEKYPHEFIEPSQISAKPHTICELCSKRADAPVHTVADKSYAPHVHDFKRVPSSERNDSLRFCATMFRCDCGESYTC